MGSWRSPPAWKAGALARGRGVRVASSPLWKATARWRATGPEHRGPQGQGFDSSAFRSLRPCGTMGSVKAKPLPPYNALYGLVKSRGTLCYAVKDAAGRIVPAGCRTVDVVYDTGAPRSVLHPRVAPEVHFPRGPLERVRGTGRAAYPTTLAFLQTPGCPQAAVAPWVSADPPEAFGVDVIVGDDYMEAADVLVSPSKRAAGCSAASRP